MSGNKKIPGPVKMIRGFPIFLVSHTDPVHGILYIIYVQAGFLTPGSSYLLRLPNENSHQ